MICTRFPPSIVTPDGNEVGPVMVKVVPFVIAGKVLVSAIVSPTRLGSKLMVKGPLPVAQVPQTSRGEGGFGHTGV